MGNSTRGIAHKHILYRTLGIRCARGVQDSMCISHGPPIVTLLHALNGSPGKVFPLHACRAYYVASCIVPLVSCRVQIVAVCFRSVRVRHCQHPTHPPFSRIALHMCGCVQVQNLHSEPAFRFSETSSVTATTYAPTSPQSHPLLPVAVPRPAALCSGLNYHLLPPRARALQVPHRPLECPFAAAATHPSSPAPRESRIQNPQRAVASKRAIYQSARDMSFLV